MTPSHTAQGLASLGRGNDSMLMHVTPNEVTGLKTLARSMGGEITTNPYTGLPEAGFLDFLGNMLPTAVALMLAAPTGGGSLAAVPATTAATTAAVAPGFFASMQMAPILGGMATGAAVAGAKGEDMLTGGLMGGLSGVGAPGMADAFSKMAAPAVGNVGSTLGNAATTLGNVGGTGEIGSSLLKSGITPAAETALSTQISPFTNNVLGSSLGVAPGANTAAANFIPGGYDAAAKSMGGLGNLSNAGSAIGDFMKNPIDAYDKYTKAGGSAMQLASSVGLPALSALQPEPLDPKLALEAEAKRKAEEDKYRDRITGGLNLTQASPDVRFVAAGGSIQSGGVRDLYGGPDNQPTMSTGLGGFGLGRLNDLASEQAMNQAKTLGYAMGGLTALKPGGYLSGGGDGMSDSIPATIEGKQQARLADGEFVIPADVVSHIGNGSSKAGSKRLYAMLDKIRQARTGNKKQGKQINPSKYMPA